MSLVHAEVWELLLQIISAQLLSLEAGVWFHSKICIRNYGNKLLEGCVDGTLIAKAASHELLSLFPVAEILKTKQSQESFTVELNQSVSVLRIISRSFSFVYILQIVSPFITKTLKLTNHENVFQIHKVIFRVKEFFNQFLFKCFSGVIITSRHTIPVALHQYNTCIC